MLDKVQVKVSCLHRPGTQKPFQFVLEPNVWWEVVLNISLQVIWGNFRSTFITIRNCMLYLRNFAFLILNVWTLANVAKISNITGWSWGGVGFQRRWRHSPGLFFWGELLFQVNLEVDGESGILLQHHYRETVRDGWVSEVSEGQFPYLYFWPCWQLADYCQIIWSVFQHV